MHSVEPVSIIIPTLNEEKHLPVLLDSLVCIDAPKEIIIVDAQSSDGTRGIAASYLQKFSETSSLRIIEAAVRGVSAQRNQGAAEATHEILMFLDADTKISGDAYEKMFEQLRSIEYSVAMPRLKPKENILKARIAYIIYNTWVSVLLTLRGQAYFAGSCLLTPRKIFRESGGFDASIRIAEDVDYAFRASRFAPPLLLSSFVEVSARRFEKYGYFRMFLIYTRQAFVFAITGVVREERQKNIYYPFGEYNA